MSQYLEFASNHPVMILALMVNVLMLAFIEYGRVTALYKNISTQEATILQNNEPTIFLDIREDGEYKTGHLIDSISIPLSRLLKELTKIMKYKDQHVVVYCASGNRSIRASKILTKGNFSNVYNLSGGINAWQKDNLPITKK